MRRTGGVFLLGLVILAQAAQSATVNGVRVWRAPDHTRFVLDLDAPVQHSLTFANNPDRIILDIPASSLNAGLNTLPLADTPVLAVRSYVQNKTDLRLVLDLKTKIAPNSFLLKAHSGMHDRLVIDLYDEPATPANATAAIVEKPAVVPVTTAVPANKNPATANPITTAPAATVKPVTTPVAVVEPTPAPASVDLQGKRTIVIAVDAGHGGEDPGAMGPNRIREKEVTLAIAKDLIAAINAQPGFSGKLTRTGDYFIPLKKRRDIARNMKADLFVSIHADAFHKSSARGASVFALSRNGATSETARFLAERENESDLIGGVGNISLDDKDQVLAGVLVDLSMTATLNSSLQVGHHVLNSMGGIAHLHKRHVEQAGFVVLKAPDVPSILVETGFISNPDESRKLATPAYRKQMAGSVFKGIRQYFYQHPPAGTYVAAQLQSGGIKDFERQHTVAAGDSLSAIATRYGVSSQQLMQYNKMNSTVVKLGQVIRIPSGNTPATAPVATAQVEPTTLPVAKPVTSSPVPRSVPILPRQHKVIAGDTLSGIASRYGVSVGQLLRHNKMKNPTVKIGQTIKIPTT
ncbi:MAG: N-acetylmuramoyl-L-alanine amidase [Cellvibrio sp. 79]|nr:MAG: N-acetylmuramoyl-L-alanine amidase [Cellvibrio sp. 79]